MSDTERGQVTASAAEVYEDFFVPALFAQWTDVVLDVAGVGAGQRVLDVGCGTGILARAARSRVGAAGAVAGIDPNDGMLAVARRADPEVDWQFGVAEHLPFADDAFDRVVSQFAVMFFDDPVNAIAEMARVTAPDGAIAFAVWDRLEHNPGYERLTAVIEDLFGADAAGAIRAPFALGDEGALAELGATGLAQPSVTRHHGTAHFASMHDWLHTEIRGWTLADVIDDDGFDALMAAAQTHLSDLAEDGPVTFDVSALVASGTPTSGEA